MVLKTVVNKLKIDFKFCCIVDVVGKRSEDLCPLRQWIERSMDARWIG